MVFSYEPLRIPERGTWSDCCRTLSFSMESDHSLYIEYWLVCIAGRVWFLECFVQWFRSYSVPSTMDCCGVNCSLHRCYSSVGPTTETGRRNAATLRHNLPTSSPHPTAVLYSVLTQTSRLTHSFSWCPLFLVVTRVASRTRARRDSSCAGVRMCQA